MQSEAGKLLYSKTALKRCTSTEHLWKRKLASLTSPEHWEIFLLRSQRSWRADVLYTPKVSIAMGSNEYRPSMLEYLSLRAAASSAAEPSQCWVFSSVYADTLQRRTTKFGMMTRT